MAKIDPEEYARFLMDKHGLHNWSLGWDRSKLTAGSCNSYLRAITLSTVAVKNCTFQEFKDTVLHEIAHALVGTKEDHNDVWKAKHIEIGGTGEIYVKQFSPYRWSLVCWNGHVLRKWHRKPSDRWNATFCHTCKSAGVSSMATVHSIDRAGKLLGRNIEWNSNVAAMRTKD